MTIDRAPRSVRNGILILVALAASCRQDPETLKRKYVASGDSYMAQKKYDAAIIEYRKAIAADPRFIWSHIALARGFLAQNKPVEAEKTLLSARRYGNFPTLERDKILRLCEILNGLTVPV